ncbi:MAG: hypothetical protein R3F59_02195 [Myxococcota bacterium]
MKIAHRGHDEVVVELLAAPDRRGGSHGRLVAGAVASATAVLAMWYVLAGDLCSTLAAVSWAGGVVLWALARAFAGAPEVEAHTVRIRRDQTLLDGAPRRMLVAEGALVVLDDSSRMVLAEPPAQVEALKELLETAAAWGRSRQGSADDVPEPLQRLSE